MKNKLLLLAALFIIAISLKAQKGVDSGTPFGSGADSLNCVKNTSLYIDYVKISSFKDAYPFWKIVYDECPGSSKNVYIYGVQIMDWLISEETDASKKEALIEEMMKLYDNRIKYFGNDPTYGKDYIISQKAQKYSQLKGESTDHTILYKWLGDAINEFKTDMDPLGISLYMFSSLKLMQSDVDKYKSQYVDDFLKTTALLDEQLAKAKAANNEKNADVVSARKGEIEQTFFVSGAADCEIMQSIYASKVEENKDNLVFLKETITLLRRVSCGEIDVYFTASEYAYKLEPSAEAASGLGAKAYRDKDIATATKYFNEVVSMSEDSELKANIYLLLANIAYEQKQYQSTKTNCLKSISEKSSNGKAYILLASVYASVAKDIFPNDPVLTKCVYYAVIDKLERARQVDPSEAQEAGRLIAIYSQYLPSADDVFMHPSVDTGETLHIGGLINETVRIK